MVWDSRPPERRDGARARHRPGTRYALMARDERFLLLRRRFRRLALAVVGSFLGWYLVYVLLSAFARGFMARPVAGNVNVALVLGVLQFVSTFVLAWGYTFYSRRSIDPLAVQLRAEAESGAPYPRRPAAVEAAARRAEVAASRRGTMVEDAARPAVERPARPAVEGAERPAVAAPAPRRAVEEGAERPAPAPRHAKRPAVPSPSTEQTIEPTPPRRPAAHEDTTRTQVIPALPLPGDAQPAAAEAKDAEHPPHGPADRTVELGSRAQEGPEQRRTRDGGWTGTVRPDAGWLG
ncbi:DUF485 domain-containing protein [Actinomadura flavalba]|uniref:DUF485 domain-containing protein n=1 Tax=Actinomadura flavalba TaxID=1120938 RepID=UPI0003A60FEF|nr:DUF485 domain-containing protein [Actinomadura flavalba]